MSLMELGGYVNIQCMVKNLHCQRETWWIGLQDRTTDLDLGELRKKLVRAIVKYLRLEPQDNKMKVS